MRSKQHEDEWNAAKKNRAPHDVREGHALYTCGARGKSEKAEVFWNRKVR